MAITSFNVVFNKATGFFTAQDTTDWAGQSIATTDVNANLKIIAPNGSTHYQNTNPIPTYITGTAQAGAASNITLAAGSSSTTDFFKNLYVKTTGGTGSGQVRKVTAYNGTTKIATVDTAWGTTPDATTTYQFCLNDIFISANTNSQGAIPLLLQTNGEIVPGTYTFEMTYWDANLSVFYSSTITYDYGFTFPTGDITPEVDPWGAYVKATDITNYTVLTVTPTLSRVFTLNFPPTVVPTPSPVVVSAAVVSTTTVYSPATYGAVLATTATWNMGGGVFIVGLITAIESINVNIDNNLCNLQCCLRDAISRVDTLQCGGYIVEANLARQQLVLALGYYLGVQGAIYCGSQAKIDEYTAKFKAILNCDDDCSCDDGDAPTLITPVVGSGGTYSFASADGSIVFTVTPSGSNTNVDAVIDPSLLALINAGTTITGLVNMTVVETSPDVFTIQASGVSAGSGITVTTTSSGGVIVDYKPRLTNLLYSNYTDVATTGTTVQTLKTYTLPAKALFAQGSRLKVKALFQVFQNTNSKIVEISVNSTTVFGTVNANQEAMLYVYLEYELYRQNATSLRVYANKVATIDAFGQEITCVNNFPTTGFITVNNLDTLTNTINVEADGSSSGDITNLDFSIEYLGN
jgi:hypothetical protein